MVVVSAEVSARDPGVVSACLRGLPRCVGTAAGVEVASVDASESSAAFLDLAGVGAPTVELSETLPAPSLRGRPVGRGRTLEVKDCHFSAADCLRAFFGGIVIDKRDRKSVV